LNRHPTDFKSRVRALIAHQMESWPALSAAVAGMAEVRDKRLTIKKSEVIAQFNPNRIVSTAARVDASTIKQRPCFLCLENLPPEEKGIAFGDDLVALCNPFPVLKNHLVVSARRHTPQAIEGGFGSMLDLAGELGGDWFTLYNGPRCGASAPDHRHFQACSGELPPVFRDVESWDRRIIYESTAIEVFFLESYRLNLLVAVGGGREALIDWFNLALDRLAEATGATEEPMINLVVTYDDGGWTAIVFPRSKHRPACYYAEGEARLTVSPAAIDLAGVLVVPQAEHFKRIGARDVERILTEVALDDARFENWVRRLEAQR
jgi:ATP adenylyltransferase/5',5'''-P-1,P-4-tetraphosphate phosphorylase II